MESGPSRVNAPLKGSLIPRSRRSLFKDQSFADSYNAYTRQTGAVRWGAACKEKVGREGGPGAGKSLWSLKNEEDLHFFSLLFLSSCIRARETSDIPHGAPGQSTFGIASREPSPLLCVHLYVCTRRAGVCASERA